MKNPLLDYDFLEQLDNQNNKEVYAKIISLNKEEKPLEEITGSITQGGSINIDGTSSVRRTCSLTMVTNQINIHEYYWGLHTKFKLYTGIKNDINPDYPDIIWFKQGTYGISSFSTSQGTNDYTISIQGKDKMSYLNGEFGGIITSLTWDFGAGLYTEVDGTVIEEKYTIKDIIMSSVNEFGQEPIQNIIINDVDDYGVELLEYRGKDPMYFIIDYLTDEVINISLDGNKTYFLGNTAISLNDSRIIYNPMFVLDGEKEERGTVLHTEVNGGGTAITVAKLEYGQTGGYRLTDLTYPSDLILNVGETLTNMLDKLVSMLGNFEYFYNIDGQFVFQKKPAYIVSELDKKLKQNNLEDKYVENQAYTSAVQYSFEDAKLISSFQNSPNFSEVKNDFSVWGTRKSISGSEIPVHFRYAIDTKPQYYVGYDNVLYATENIDFNQNIGENNEHVTYVDEFPTSWVADMYRHYDNQGNFLHMDWCVNENGTRFPIYALYFDYDDDFIESTTGAKKIHIGDIFRCPGGSIGDTGVDYDPFSKETSYWQIIDSDTYLNDRATVLFSKLVIKNPEQPTANEIKIVDWREIIYQMQKDFRRHNKEDDFLYTVRKNNPITCPSGYTGYEQYYTDIEGFWRTLYNPEYIGSFNTTYVTNKTYDMNNLYYAFPNYVQSAETEGYHQNVTYYILESLSYSRITTLVNEIEYNKMSSGVFYKDGDNYIKVTRTDKYISGRNYYIDNKVFKEVSITKTEYLKNPTNYWYIEGEDEIRYCKWDNKTTFNSSLTYYKKVDDEFDIETYWANSVLEYPEKLNFWIDFLDIDGIISKYSVKAIGDRTKAVNDSNVKSIYFRDTPNVIFVEPDAWNEQNQKESGYTYIKLPNYMENLFSLSTQGKSAKDVIDEYLYKYAYCAEQITISAIPIYYLQPNTRIFVRNENSSINGEYIITRISLPLGANGMMSITATKVVDTIY